jgi:pimeloyl-ACP methyl ester carboxylesterase
LLAPHFTIIRPDNRTTGRTAPWDAPVSVAQMADDALALMRHLGQDRYHLAGHSMGGLIGTEIAALAGPEQVASLTILASTPVRSPRTMAVFRALLEIRKRTPEQPDLWLRALYPWIFRPGFFAAPETVEEAIAAALAYPHGQGVAAMELQMQALASYRPRKYLTDVACPVRAVLAGHEILIDNAAARTAFEALERVDLHEIAEAGHSVVWDAPEEVALHIRAAAGLA